MCDSVPSASYSSVCNVYGASHSSLLIESTDSMIDKHFLLLCLKVVSLQVFYASFDTSSELLPQKSESKNARLRCLHSMYRIAQAHLVYVRVH